MITISARRLTIGIASCSSALLISIPSLADTKYISKDGNLVVQYGKKCSTTKPTGTYSVRNGASGELKALSCEGLDGDVFDHKFNDAAGNERCYGRMTHAWSQKVYTIRKIKGVVSGYPCSQVRKTFTLKMDSGKQI